MSKLSNIPEKKEVSEKFANKGITQKEYELIALLAEGYSNREIAETLF